MTSRFNYLSPLILPVLPRRAGATLFSINLANALAEAAAGERDGDLECLIEQFENRQVVATENISVRVREGVPDPIYVDRRFEGDTLGYVQISITADRPFFHKLISEHVYSLIERPDHGTFILNASHKYSVPVIIDLMRRVGRFCLVHPAHYVNASSGAGNSALIINPFDGPIVARLATAGGEEMRRRVQPREAAMIPLQELIEDGQFTCVLYTGNNRYPAWDVRHAYDAPDRVNRVDHLEFFRGDPTERRLPAAAFLRAKARSTMRTLGLRN